MIGDITAAHSIYMIAASTIMILRQETEWPLLFLAKLCQMSGIT
jgi:hypothetical protein